MTRLLTLILLSMLFMTCEIPHDSNTQENVVPPYTIVASVAGSKNQANIQRIVHTVLVDSSYLDKIESDILPSLAKKYDDRNMNQFLLYSKDPVDILALKEKSITDIYKAAKKGSIALINKSSVDDGILLYEY
ncbi:hypothetical protein [Neolewinella agarilytica]|uniref:Uncharacterized protein n=1 Tax=Neolewinella agarilytica TaxID=478744 RepID=A0A1H9M1L4_9BACT|nr:hypothetical protein [Neolewinella agarilytica]SER16953.1 hypothetical protein SAMN05444359_12657 [Neolewinella agarilytica]